MIEVHSSGEYTSLCALKVMQFIRVLAGIALFCLLLAAGVAVSFSWLYPTYTVRYRLTVTVASQERQSSGSSVVEVRMRMQPNLLDNPRWSFRVDGEAVFVDLGGGRNLVAPLSPGPSKGAAAVGILFRAFGIPFLSENASSINAVRGERSLRREDWPAFVTFRAINDALSVEPVDPANIEIVPGSRVESVTLAITQEAVTHKLLESLPWLTVPLTQDQIVELARRHFSRRDFTRTDP